MSDSEHRLSVSLALDVSRRGGTIGWAVCLSWGAALPKDRLAVLHGHEKSAQLPILTIIR